MSDRSERFRRLKRPPETADLFEHFGVQTEPVAPPVELVSWPEPCDATPCPACGWYRPLVGECDLCGGESS